MTTKHTPGPWTIEDGIRGTTAIIGSDTDGGTAVLARLPHWPIEKEMQASNARLIAAAPELADALRLAMDTIDSLHGHYCPNCKGGCPDLETIAIGRAALEKAGAA
jgi:hypothetical protein